jgi:hypothetical protein
MNEQMTGKRERQAKEDRTGRLQKFWDRQAISKN